MTDEQRIRRGLVTRHTISSSLKNELYEKFLELSKQTRISKSLLLDEAIEDLLSKWGIK